MLKTGSARLQENDGIVSNSVHCIECIRICIYIVTTIEPGDEKSILGLKK